MTSSNISYLEENLSQLRRKQEIQIRKMDEWFLAIKDKTPAFVIQWVKTEVEEKIRNNHEAYRELTSDQVKELKRQLSENSNNIPNEVENLFADQTYWPHHRPYTSTRTDPNYELEDVQEIVKKLINPLGKILKNYKLTKEAKGVEEKWNFTQIDDEDPKK